MPPLAWVSDVASVLHCGFQPVFADIDPRTLGMNTEQILARITSKTRAVFLTHILGYNALTQRLLDELAARRVPLIEDVCESYGATFVARKPLPMWGHVSNVPATTGTLETCPHKLGTFSLMSNFSFYYAHHMTTIEGGMISTDNEELYQTLRMLRAHGLVRESSSPAVRDRYRAEFPDLNPDFIFAFPAYNVRSTEINAVLGRSQLRRLDEANRRRTENLQLFLDGLDPAKYRTDFLVEGSCNYAFTLVQRKPDEVLSRNLMETLRRHGVEFRRGTSGGGNQLRQPYLRSSGPRVHADYPEAEHVHFFGYYIGNYPGLEPERIRAFCELVNAVPSAREEDSCCR